MDEVIIIDIKAIIRYLLKRWLYILIPVVLLIAGAYFYLSQKPITYTATASVAITRPQTLANVNQDFESKTDYTQQPYKAYVDLAKSNELIEDLYAYWSEIAEDDLKFKKFKANLTANQGNDTTIIKLQVSLENPKEAQLVANYWAELLVEKINELYYGKNEAQVNYFAEQLANSKEIWDESNQAIIAFNSQNSINSINNQLISRLDRENEILSQQRKNKRVVNDILDLKNIVQDTNASTLSATDQISTLLLQTGLLSNGSNIQLQITDPQQLNFQTKTEQLNYLNNLLEVMDENWVTLQSELEALEPEILALQEKLTRVEAEKEVLEQERSLAKETYESLKIKYEETRINYESDFGGLQIAANATMPLRPDSRHLMTYPFVAGIVGGLGAIMIILVIGWWNNAFDFSPKKVEEETEG